MHGGYGFWSPTHNPAAHRAFLEHIDKRRQQAARGRAPNSVAAKWILALIVAVVLLAVVVEHVL